MQSPQDEGHVPAQCSSLNGFIHTYFHTLMCASNFSFQRKCSRIRQNIFTLCVLYLQAKTQRGPTNAHCIGAVSAGLGTEVVDEKFEAFNTKGISSIIISNS